MNLIAYILVLALSFSNGSINSLSNMEENAVNYMNKTYKDTFTFISHADDMNRPETEVVPYHEVYVSSKKYPDKIISVYCDKDSETILFDGYLEVKYEDETRQLIQKCVDKISNQNYLFYELDQMNGFSKETKNFATYRSSAESDIYFEAVIQVDDNYNKADIVHNLEIALSDAHLCCQGKIYVNSKINFDIINDDTFTKYRGSQFYDNMLTFEMDNPEGFAVIDWMY